MMSDTVLLDEIAKNERVIEHPEFGRFIIRRPTHGVEAQIETARTRQINRDLQARDVIEDPITGERKEVPAFLTRKARADQLRFHGLWTHEDEYMLEEATDRYRDVAFKLEAEGFEGGWKLDEDLNALREKIRSVLGNKADKHKDAIDTVVPYLLTAAEGERPQDQDTGLSYSEARLKLQKVTKKPEMDRLLNEADRLHRLVSLYNEGVKAQAEMVAYRIREISLFSDTLESRADRAAHVAKVFYCTFTEDHKPVWKTIPDLEKEPSMKLRWLLGEIERFERVEPGETEEDIRRRERFNFLSPYQGTPESSDDSPEAPSSNLDGDSAEKPTTSSEV